MRPFNWYDQTSNISLTLIGNTIFDDSGIVGASPRRCSNHIFILVLASIDEIDFKTTRERVVT